MQSGTSSESPAQVRILRSSGQGQPYGIYLASTSTEDGPLDAPAKHSTVYHRALL